MTKNEPKEAASFIKAKAVPGVGYRTSSFVKGKTFSPKGQFYQNNRFNTTRFITQHKGGS